MPHPCSLNRSRGKKSSAVSSFSLRRGAVRRLGRLAFLLVAPFHRVTSPRNSPLSSVANETKIKCKWKFIAPGDRRRFRTFKYFINFLLLRSGRLFLVGTVVPVESHRESRDDGNERDRNKWNDLGTEWALLHPLVDFLLPYSREPRYMHTIYRNVIKTSKRQWIANQVTFPFSCIPCFGRCVLLLKPHLY